MEIIGYIGGVFLTVSGIPEVIRTIKDKKCHIGWNMLVLWFLGEIFITTYAFHVGKMPLIINYVVNFFVVTIMLWYKSRTYYRQAMKLTAEHQITFSI